MKKHQENAFAAAAYLKTRKEISSVYFPGFPEHPGYKTALRQMSGQCGVVSFELKGGEKAAYKFASRLRVFSLADSLGGVESLANYPRVQTHSSLTEKQRLERGVTPGLIRLSCGIEDKDDLISDLSSALKGL